MVTRRTLIKVGAAAGAGMLLPIEMVDRTLARLPRASAFLDPLTLTKYVDPLPIIGTMPQAAPNAYVVGVFEKTLQLHSQMAPTKVWAYGSSSLQASSPGATFETRRGTPVSVQWQNNLNGVVHPLPVDPTLDWANPNDFPPPTPPFAPFPPGYAQAQSPVPITTHLHGAEVRSDSDGHPLDWMLPGAVHNNLYPNAQEATTLWYHDHAMGMTRINVHMGLLGLYIVRDPQHEPSGLPARQFEIPLILQDRLFDANSQTFFPVDPTNPDVHPYWTPEFFGDTILVNGKVWPFLEVEQRRYRFRILNGSNARFYDLDFGRGTEVWQIGTDGGYLNAAVPLKKVLIAPAERADVIVDFTDVPAGSTITVTNDANAPFPGGDPVDPNTTGQIMRFRVVRRDGTDPSLPPDRLTLRETPLPALTPTVTRQLTLNELASPTGPLQVRLNNTRFGTPVTELPRTGTTEQWELINLTEDAHPIHLHLIQFQLVDRQKFNQNAFLRAYADAYGGTIPDDPTGPPNDYSTPNEAGALGGNPAPSLTGSAASPAEDFGWKDTIKVLPGQVTRIRVRFAEQDGNAFPFDATAGPGYVWHCHILDHEDNEMMRGLKLT